MADIKRMWINQPSTLQPHHHRHGERVLAARESANVHRVWPLSGPIVSEQITSICLSQGWPA